MYNWKNPRGKHEIDPASLPKRNTMGKAVTITATSLILAASMTCIAPAFASNMQSGGSGFDGAMISDTMPDSQGGGQANMQGTDPSCNQGDQTGNNAAPSQNGDQNIDGVSSATTTAPDQNGTGDVQPPADGNMAQNLMPPAGDPSVGGERAAIDQLEDGDAKTALQTLLDAYNDAVAALHNAAGGDTTSLQAAVDGARSALDAAIDEAGIQIPTPPEGIGGQPGQPGGQQPGNQAGQPGGQTDQLDQTGQPTGSQPDGQQPSDQQPGDQQPSGSQPGGQQPGQPAPQPSGSSSSSSEA